MDRRILGELSLELSINGLIFFDPTSMKILFMNAQALTYFTDDSEFDYQELSIGKIIRGKNVDRIYHQDSFYGELELEQSDGGFVPILASIRIAEKNEFKVGLVSFQDLSNQKKILRDLTIKQEGLTEVLQELLRKNEELEKLDKAKDKFLSLVTHELRTPLNTVVATSELIFYRSYENEEEFSTLGKNLYQQSQHMLHLVNDILDMTKIYAGKMEFFIEYKDPSVLIKEQAGFFQDMAKENSVEIVMLDFPEDVECYIDELRLRQILTNLIGNAIKFNRPRGKVTLAIATEANNVNISVTDTGVGISKDKFDSIFNEFETIENLANHHKGTGLGLPIVKNLVLGMGGKIDLESTLGVGSVFRVILPKEKVLLEELYRSRQNDGFTLFSGDS